MLYWQIRSGEEPRIACDGCMVVGLRMLCATRGPLEHSGCALAFCCRDTLPLLGNSIIPAAMLWTLAKNMQQLHAVIDGWLIIVESENLVGQWATPHRRLNLEVLSPNMSQWSRQEVCDAISLVEGSWLSMAFLYLLVILPSSCWMCVDTGCISGSIGASCGGCSRQVHVLRVDLWHAEIHFESFWFLQFGWLISKQSYREWTKSCPCVMIFTCWFGIGLTRTFAMKCKVTAARLWKPVVKLCFSTCFNAKRKGMMFALSPMGSFWVIYTQRGLAHTHTHMWILNLNSHLFLCMLYIYTWIFLFCLFSAP